MSETPNAEALAAFSGRADEGPVVMLNLIKYREDGGAESYARYAAKVTPLLNEVGGEVLYGGRGAELIIGKSDEDWDYVLLIRYPNRSALVKMISSPDYQAVMHHRTDSLVRSVLLATDPGLPGA